jgi:hypothetical protein
MSFDHLISLGQDRWRHSKPERLGRLEVDNHDVSCRLLNRHLGRRGASQDVVHVVRVAAGYCERARSDAVSRHRETSGIWTRS